MYKMIVLDLDGTLLNSDSIVSKKNKWMIKKCREQGLKIVLASGRMYYSMDPIIKELQLEEDSHVGGNGAIIFSLQGYVKIVSALENRVYRNLIGKIKKENIQLLSYSKENIYYDYAPQLSHLILNFQDVELTQVKSVMQLKNIIKVVLYVKDKERDKEERVRDIIKNHAAVFRSHKSFLDIVHHSTNKYRAIEELMQQYKIHPKEVIAIGDSENDVEMIKNVGLGVAMPNGSEEAKKAAKYIAPKTNNEDGVADILERFA